MSKLTDDPELMLEALCVLVKRLGGSVTITEDEAPGAFNLLSKWEPGKLHLVLDTVAASAAASTKPITREGE